MGYKRDDLPQSGGDFFKGDSPELANKQRLTLTIADVELREFEAKGDREASTKLIVSFRETDKLLAANFTNREIMFEELDEDTDGWIGRQIIVYVGTTKMGPGVKVRVPAGQPAPVKAAKVPDVDLDDDDDFV